MSETESDSRNPTPEPGEELKPQFVLVLGDLQKPLEPGQNYTIGKESSCDLRLGHGTVSPIHCRLEVTEDAVIVHDLNSLAGTKVAGEPVMDGAWTPGQTLEVGDIRVDLERRVVIGPWMLPSEATAGSEPEAQSAAVAAAAIAPGAIALHRHDETFGEVMFRELKRAPWLAMSLIVHAGVLLLFWIFLDEPLPKGPEGRTFSLIESTEEDSFEEEILEEEVQLEEMNPDAELLETEAEEEEEELIFDESDLADQDNGLADTDALMTKVGGSGLDDILRAGKGALSGKFKKTVAGLRRNGLEIVFVFDSTGSMGTVLQAAKDRMEKMASVMLELVPYARIGVITYRDRGPSNSYLTKQVALSRDFYRSINFLQTVYAAGGGDEPEAVYDALKVAMKQKWSPSARRMVILIGDAPPHKKDESRISSLVRSFAHTGKSQVHAIITRPSGGDEIAKAAQKTFKRIARDGQGEALEFTDEGKILRAVMTLAFGRQEKRSLDEVYELVEGRARRASSRAERIAAGKDKKFPTRLRQEFMRPIVKHDVIKAILLEPKARVLDALVDMIAEDKFNNPGKHAAAYILARLLHLDEAPVDPETCRGISQRRARSLKRLIEKKYR